MDRQRRRADRRDTDESLRTERKKTDELLQTDRIENRVEQIVRGKRQAAETRLRNAREDVDGHLEKQIDVLPEVSEKLEQVAGSLTQAAARLCRADTLKEPLRSPATAGNEKTDATAFRQPVQVVTNLAHVAEELKVTADRINEPRSPDAQEASGKLAGQLAELAEGMADVTTTLAEERRDADDGLRKERDITDRIIVQELEKVETAVAEDLTGERDVLTEERTATDRNLAKERQNTDGAVEYVLDLLEEEQKAHAAAQRSVATRNEFLGIVSHDLRGPLMTISGAAVLIEQHARYAGDGDPSGKQVRGWTDMIRRAVATMERLIHDLLDFGSFEDGQLRVHAERQDITGLIRSAVGAFQASAAAKNISLEADLPGGPVMAKYDQHRMHQVLSNLLHNAIKFTLTGGSIRVRVSCGVSECIVAVADTGIGIPKQELTAIFERFRRLDGTDRTGLGLGLYISMWIVEAHGGRIWAESQVGTGSTFYFTLPEN